MVANLPRDLPRHGERDYSRIASTAFDRRHTAVTALVVGAGALGNEVMKNLALIGVARMWIVDRDHVEASNLTRSILFCTPDITDHIASHSPKAELAAARIAEINPDVEVNAFVGEIADLGAGLLRRADIVFSCLDNEMARLELSWACTRLNKLLVDGGLGLFNYSSGQVSVFPGEHGPCYACRKGSDRRGELLQELQGREDPCWRKEDALEAAAAVTTTPIMASVVGALQVELGLRARGAETEQQVLGRAYQLTLHPQPELRSVTFERSPLCPLHDPQSVVTDLRECAEARSDRWTPRDVLRETGGRYLALDWPITARATCRSCGHEWEPMLRRARFRRATCPGCESRDLVETDVLNMIDERSPWAGRSLASLGLPSGHVYEVICGGDAEAERVHVEISGDWVPQAEQ
jgi:adenylyltransferase/sulfurtransferase